jgi:uncharacterized protein (TIGR03435 family)
VEFTYENLKSLIGSAYKLKPNQITGPDWMANERFDIIARFRHFAAATLRIHQPR